MNLAVIPARGGSQRIPGKNSRDFCGKPVIAYSIAAALQSGVFERVMVSTDDDGIARVAREHGAEVPFMRPASLSDNLTGTADVVRHALQWHLEQGVEVEYACCIYATAPMLEAAVLADAYRQLRESGKHYAFSVTSYEFPVRRALRITAAGGIEPVFPDAIDMRSQDLEEVWHDAGQFYWGRAQAYIDRVTVFSEAALPIVLPRYRVQDIDTDEDWRRAELMYRALHAG